MTLSLTSLGPLGIITKLSLFKIVRFQNTSTCSTKTNKHHLLHLLHLPVVGVVHLWPWVAEIFITKVFSESLFHFIVAERFHRVPWTPAISTCNCDKATVAATVPTMQQHATVTWHFLSWWISTLTEQTPEVNPCISVHLCASLCFKALHPGILPSSPPWPPAICEVSGIGIHRQEEFEGQVPSLRLLIFMVTSRHWNSLTWKFEDLRRKNSFNVYLSIWSNVLFIHLWDHLCIENVWKCTRSFKCYMHARNRILCYIYIIYNVNYPRNYIHLYVRN